MMVTEVFLTWSHSHLLIVLNSMEMILINGAFLSNYKQQFNKLLHLIESLIF